MKNKKIANRTIHLFQNEVFVGTASGFTINPIENKIQEIIGRQNKNPEIRLNNVSFNLELNVLTDSNTCLIVDINIIENGEIIDEIKNVWLKTQLVSGWAIDESYVSVEKMYGEILKDSQVKQIMNGIGGYSIGCAVKRKNYSELEKEIEKWKKTVSDLKYDVSCLNEICTQLSQQKDELQDERNFAEADLDKQFEGIKEVREQYGAKDGETFRAFLDRKINRKGDIIYILIGEEEGDYRDQYQRYREVVDVSFSKETLEDKLESYKVGDVFKDGETPYIGMYIETIKVS